MMEAFQHHEMNLEVTHPSGVEQWGCPTCGRRLLLQWPPNYRKIVLEAGDETAFHAGGKGGLTMGHASIGPVDPASPVDDGQLETWSRWLDETDFENLWRS